MTRPAVHELWIEAAALWTPALPGFEAARSAWRQAAPGGGEPPAAAARPAPTLLAANERRRAPDGVLMALQVAEQAAAASGRDRRTLPTVFASAHGDLAITHALCRTLAADPALLSPTRFHHSVHNAASGYWAIAAQAPAASTALSAQDGSFAAGWLEALAQALADDTAVLLVAFDTEAPGPLASVNTSRGLLAAAWVLAPRPGPAARWRMRCWLDTTPAHALPPPEPAPWGTPAANASAPALPLLHDLALDRASTRAWALSDTLALWLAVAPMQQAGRSGAHAS